MAATSYTQKMRYLELSPVKKERLKKAENERRKRNMRAALPILTIEEIRRHRLPYHEAIVSELETTGYPHAAEFLKQLMQYQEMIRQQHGPDTIVYNRPQLVKSEAELDIMFQGLRNAERANQNDDRGGECDELLTLAIRYGFGSDDWWWLGEQLLLQCVRVGRSLKSDGGKREAISKYIYAKFLLESMRDYAGAQKQLVDARRLSHGLTWTASKYLNVKQNTVFIESCMLLNKCMLEEAKLAMRIFKYDEAIRLCVVARKRAAEACFNEGEAEALLLKGKCELFINDTESAITSLLKALAVHIKHDSKEGICEARVQLALAYIRQGSNEDALRQLNELMEFAQANNIPHYIAQSYRYLGKYYISKGEATKATPLLIKAIKLFHEQGNITDMEQVRNFAAISAAQELLPRYTKLIVKCDNLQGVQFEYLSKLVKWKNTREVFWEEEKDDASSEELEDIQQIIEAESGNVNSEVNVDSKGGSKKAIELQSTEDLEGSEGRSDEDPKPPESVDPYVTNPSVDMEVGSVRKRATI